MKLTKYRLRVAGLAIASFVLGMVFHKLAGDSWGLILGILATLTVLNLQDENNVRMDNKKMNNKNVRGEKPCEQ